jgi:hypothetical protein
MIELTDFEARENDRVIQLALREIDTTVLARAMVAWDEAERMIILRNMSKRAAAMLMDEVGRLAGSASEKSSTEAKEFFLQKLRKYREYVARSTIEPPAEMPALRTESAEAIVASFVDLVRLARHHGILALEGVAVESDLPLAKKGLELCMDGWDPMLAREILERSKRTYLDDVERRLDMLIIGFDSLKSGDLAIATEERLRAYLM